MELVYLWVEDYKNIYEQGFNFSPRFNCDYDEDSKELTIDENKDYIPDFFGENINVTAIVGKNGSGKSSVLKLIMLLIFYNKYNDLPHESLSNNDKNLYMACESIFNSYEHMELFCIIKQEKKFKKLSINCADKTIKYNQKSIKINNITGKELDFFTIHFNYMLDTLYDGGKDGWVKSIYHKADSYETPLLLEPYKNNNNKQLIDLDIIEYLNNQNMLRFYASFNGNEKLVDFFTPNKVNISIGKLNTKVLEMIGDDYEFTDKETYKLVDKYYKLLPKFKIHSNDRSFAIQEKIEQVCNTQQAKNINILYVAFKILSSNKELFDTEIYIKLTKWIEDEISHDNLIPRDILMDNYHEFKNVFHKKEDIPNYEIRKIVSCIKFFSEDIGENEFFDKAIRETWVQHSLEELKGVLAFIPPWIDVEWFEEQKSIQSLSSGEKSFFTFIINLMYQVKNIDDIEAYKTINLILDETELGFHPEWQKEYLQRILFALEKISKKKINLIFATHSPFLISDLPKGNIIFLKDGQQDEGIKHNQTFGANIHTLLSDSFFMEDGLMGEFAKSKINKIIDFHRIVEKSKHDDRARDGLNKAYTKKKKRFWDTQSIIGEEYLKQVVKNHLVDIENILLGHDEAKRLEIERLREEADRLENM